MVLELVCRAVLLVVFASAVVGKAHSPKAFEDFRDSVVALARPGRWAGAVANPVATALAIGVVAAEAAVVVLLMVPGVRWAGYVLSGLLLAAFAAAVVGAMRAKRRIRCRCFGSGGSVLGRAQLTRNALLIAVAAVGWAIAPGVVSASAGLLALVVGGLLGLAVTRWDDVVFVFGGRFAPAVSGRDR